MTTQRPSVQQTLEQKRAAQAWKHIERLARDRFVLEEKDFDELQKSGIAEDAIGRLRPLLKQKTNSESQFVAQAEATLDRTLEAADRDKLVRAAAKPNPHAGKYGGWVKKLPALILTNGLGQTLAFLRAKGKGENNAPQILYTHISKWVMYQAGSSDSLLEWILKQDSTAYRQATTETLAFVNWLKRFAEAELKIEEVTD